MRHQSRREKTCHTKEIRVFSVFEKKIMQKDTKIQYECKQDYVIHTRIFFRN